MIAIYVLAAFGALCAVSLAVGPRILKRFERGERFRASLVIVGFVERMHRVSLGIVTMPILTQAATRDDVCIDVSAELCYRRVDASAANVNAAMTSIIQSATCGVVRRRTLAATISEPDSVARSIRELVEHQARTRGVTVTSFTFESIQLPGDSGREMTRRAGAEHEQSPSSAGAGDAVADVIAELEALPSRTPQPIDGALASGVTSDAATSAAFGTPRANGPAMRPDGPS